MHKAFAPGKLVLGIFAPNQLAVCHHPKGPSIGDAMHQLDGHESSVPITLTLNVMCFKLLRLCQPEMLSFLLFGSTKRVSLPTRRTPASLTSLEASARMDEIILDSTRLRIFLGALGKTKMGDTIDKDAVDDAENAFHNFFEIWTPWSDRLADCFMEKKEEPRVYDNPRLGLHVLASHCDRVDCEGFVCRGNRAVRDPVSPDDPGWEAFNDWMTSMVYTERLWREFATKVCKMPPSMYNDEMQKTWALVWNMSVEELARGLPGQCVAHKSMACVLDAPGVVDAPERPPLVGAHRGGGRLRKSSARGSGGAPGARPGAGGAGGAEAGD